MSTSFRAMVENVSTRKKLVITDLIALGMKACTAEIKDQTTKSGSWDENTHPCHRSRRALCFEG